ncbi:MAG: DNA polymerase I, partial [Muribaculaceae bacterium]|nr:DNA polymerase I [Muribaculaceae bacterium]
QILFSKFLVTIKTDVPLDDIAIDSLVRRETDVDALLKVYRELEFRTFINRLMARQGEQLAPVEAPVKATDDSGMGSLFDLPAETVLPSLDNSCYKTASTPAEVNTVIDKALADGKVGLSVYAIGEEAMTASLQGVAIAFGDDSAVFIPVHTAEDVAPLGRLFANTGVTIAGHDIKRAYLLMKRAGIEWKAPIYDTSVAHYLLDPEARHDIEQVAKTALNVGIVHGAPDARKPYPPIALDPEIARLRYCEEAAVSLRLMPSLNETIESEGMTKLLTDIEFPLIMVLADMEWTGVRIDVAELAALHSRLTARLGDIEQEVYNLAGQSFNISSPMQVGEILFEKLKIASKAKKTSKGAYSTTEQILEKYRNAHPIVDLILKIRRLRKLLATYIDALPRLINPATGKIHTSYNQTVTATGRLSSANPNLQNIPIRTDDGRDVRRAFIPDDGDLLLSADYSQIELRLIADISRDADMVDAFLSGADIHTATAAKIYHETIDAVSDDQRRRAKTANFGIIYGISAFGLSERLSIPRAEAKELINGYFRSYPGIKAYMEQSVEKAREEGAVSTIMGRKRRLPDINSRNAVVRGYAERNAINAPIQGSAADIIKIAMVNIARHITEQGLKSRMTMQVHDELIFNVKPDELETLKAIVLTDMADAYHGLVPLEVAAGVATNWLDAH